MSEATVELDDQREAEITVAYHKVMHDAVNRTRTDEERDQVMSVLYNIVISIGPDDGDGLNLPTVTWVPA